MLNVVSAGGILAHSAAEGAGRGRLHPANPDPPGANHHIKGSLKTPRSLRSARGPEPTLRASEPPRSLRLRVSPNSASPHEPRPASPGTCSAPAPRDSRT